MNETISLPKKTIETAAVHTWQFQLFGTKLRVSIQHTLSKARFHQTGQKYYFFNNWHKNFPVMNIGHCPRSWDHRVLTHDHCDLISLIIYHRKIVISWSWSDKFSDLMVEPQFSWSSSWKSVIGWSLGEDPHNLVINF